MVDDRKRGGCGPLGCATSIGVVILAPVLYVLSVGPAHRAAALGSMSWDAYHAIYGPLWANLDGDTPPGKWLYWYTEWWSPPPPGE